MQCPACKGERVVKMLYGFPGPAWQEAAQRGEIGLGGCQWTPGSPSHQCRDCGHRFVWPDDASAGSR